MEDGLEVKKVTRSRKSNWSREETDILVNEVEAAKSLLHGKFHSDGSRISPQERFKAWAVVAHKVNASAPCKRAVSEVKKKWQDIKFLARRKEETFTRQESKYSNHENASSNSNHSADISNLSKPSWVTSDHSVAEDEDMTGNMSLYLECMETFQESVDNVSGPGNEEASITSSSYPVPDNVELMDKVRQLQGNAWSAEAGLPTFVHKDSYSEKLLEIEREKLKVKKEKLQVLKDMLKVQKERLELHKQKQQQQIFLVQPTVKGKKS